MKKLIILTLMMLTAALSASSSLCAQNPYAHGTYIDDIICKVEDNAGSPTELYYHTDRQFNVRGLTDTNGDVVELYTYTVYGKQTVMDGAGNTLLGTGNSNLYGFTGRYLDSETGLWYFRARYFDDELGRFNSRDPLGYVDGYGLYGAYFAQGFGVDPSGTKWVKTNVRYCIGYEKVNDKKSKTQHIFIETEGKSYGLYAYTHADFDSPPSFGSSLAAVVLSFGFVQGDEFSRWPEVKTKKDQDALKKKDFYSRCFEVWLDDCCFDKTLFESYASVVPEMDKHKVTTYNACNTCMDYVHDDILDAAMNFARKGGFSCYFNIKNNNVKIKVGDKFMSFLTLDDFES